MSYTVDNEGGDVIRVRLSALRTQLGSLQRLADAMRAEMARLDLDAPNGIANGTGVILYNAGLLRTKNKDALERVGQLVTALGDAIRDLESAGRTAGHLMEVADEDSGRHIAGN